MYEVDTVIYSIYRYYYIFKSQKIKEFSQGHTTKIRSDQSLSCVRLFVTPWTAAHQAPPSMGYSRQEYWSGVPLPSPVWMWELDYKESWAPKNWYFWTVVLEKTIESLLDCKEIQPVHSKGNQPWIFIGRTDAEAKTPILWPPDAKNWLIWKDPDAGKD